MALNMITEADRCLGCKKPLCAEGCPVHTRIPEIIRMFKEHDISNAGRILFENNPMSVVCAIVCNHEAQCTGHCVLGRKGNPVHFYDIERYISETYLGRMQVQKPVPNGKKAAIIGSGPAGISAAFILAQNGCTVTVFDEKEQTGGMLRYGIPDFRLPHSLLEKYQKKMLEMGIHIRPNTVLGGALHIDDLFRDGYDTVLIATGTWRPKTLGLHGESLPNVHFGISYLSSPSSYHLGETVAVLGMGNVAMDVARTAFRNGARRVNLYARSRRIAASEDEVAYTKLDGAQFHFGKLIQRFSEEGPVFKNAIFDENGSVTGYEEEEVLEHADSTIIAVSQGPKNKLLLTTADLEANDRGLLITDDNRMTTRDGVFAAGDVVHGSLTVVHAVEDAKIAAAAMLKYMENKSTPTDMKKYPA